MSDEQHSPLFHAAAADPCASGGSSAADDRAPTTDGSSSAGATPAQLGELLATTQRIAAAVEELRGRMETLTRERRHQHFSPGRLIGVVLEVIVLGLVIVAVADWAYDANVGSQLAKLALAGVLQLGALTAFILGRDTA